MFWSYTVSVVVLSLALYGLWHVVRDVWNWFMTIEIVRLPDVSFIILVRNMECEIEDLMRYLMREIESSDRDYDVVVVDCGSDDLTPKILSRLAGNIAALTALNVTRVSRPVAEALPLCRGAVVHVIDLTARLKIEEFMAVVASLLRRDGREVAIKTGEKG